MLKPNGIVLCQLFGIRHIGLHYSKTKIMSSKAENQSIKNLQSTRKWGIFFRNPFLLKILAWLSSLSLILATSGIWVEAQAKSSVGDNPSVNVELKIPSSPVIKVDNTTEKLPSATVNPVETSRVKPSKHSDVLKGEHLVIGVIESNQNNQVRPYTPPSQEKTGNNTLGNCNGTATQSQLVTAGCSQVKPRQKRSRISTSVPLSSISPKLAPTDIGVREIAVGSPDNNKATSPAPMAAAPKPIPQGQLLRPSNQQNRNLIITPLPVNKHNTNNNNNVKITPLPSTPQSVTPPVIKPVVPPTELPSISGFKPVPVVPPLPVIEIPTANNSANNFSNSNYQFTNLSMGNNINNPVDISNGGMIYPLSVPVPTTSNFGWRIHPITGGRRFHAGIDFGAPYGTPVVAVAGGKVIEANWMGGYGKTIIIQHNDRQQTLYAHLADIFIQPGQIIEQGTVIGRVGSTGNSTGPHLHFETKVFNGNSWVAVDPANDVRYALANLRRSIALSPSNNRPRIN